jgi:NCS1 family nucleobase:cation symporter-1
MEPWRLLADPSGYVFKWLGGYAGGLGSIAGVLIADYWLIRRKHLALGDLYKTRGIYTYAGGWNWRAVVATLLGCALAWGGLVIPPLRPLYDYAWFVGLFVSGTAYTLLMKGVPAAGAAQRLESVPEQDGD